MSINQFDIFGHEVSEAEMIEKAALERKRYKTMQALYGTKEGFKCKNCNTIGRVEMAFLGDGIG